MDNGMTCGYDKNTLEQLGIKTEEDKLNFINFSCKSCGKFVHLHALMPIEADNQEQYCAPCNYEKKEKHPCHADAK